MPLRIVPSKETDQMIQAFTDAQEHSAPEWEAMLSATPNLTRQQVNELCKAYSATNDIYDGVEPWWEPDTKHMHRDSLREKERARMTRFLAAAFEQKCEG